jgi:hypothetical protein
VIPRGFLIRGVAIALGVVPLMFLLDTIALKPDLAAVAIVVYAAVTGCYFGNYAVEHQDEIPSRAPRR